MMQLQLLPLPFAPSRHALHSFLPVCLPSISHDDDAGKQDLTAPLKHHTRNAKKAGALTSPHATALKQWAEGGLYPTSSRLPFSRSLTLLTFSFQFPRPRPTG